MKTTIFLLKIFCLLITTVNAKTPCARRYIDKELVCVCNETYCDTYEDVLPTKKNSYVITSTTKAGLRFDSTSGHIPKDKELKIIVQDYEESTNNDKPRHVELKVEFNKRNLEIIGFGGAFTGSVSYILNLLPKRLQHRLYESYYSLTKGIGYNMMRLIIGGCDCDLKPWSYAETPEFDKTLSGFTQLNEEDLIKIRQIKELKKVTKNNDIKNLGSAWTSPRWMKTNYSWTPPNRLQRQYYQTFANYYLQWLRLMAKEDINLWGMTLINEPLNGIENWKFIHFVALGFTGYEQGVWLGENFGPLIRNSEFADLKLFGLDDENFAIPWWYTEMNKGFHNATKYLTGLAKHWYADFFVPIFEQANFHKKYPDQILINTESSIFGAHKIGEWSYAETYIVKLILNFNNYLQAWLDWNLLLDMNGGPNYSNNFLPSAINVDTNSRKEFYKNSIFYALGHFSKFLVPGSVHVHSSSRHLGIQSIAFVRPDETKIIILYNNHNATSHIKYQDDSGLKMHITVPPRSIHTLAFKH